MRAIHIKEMAEAVRKRELYTFEYYLYLTLFWYHVISLLTIFRDRTHMHDPEWLQHISNGFSIVIVGSSVLAAFIANRQGDGKDFWYRFAGIHFVAALYVLLTSMPFLLALFNVLRNPINSGFVLQPVDMLVIALAVVVFNHLIYTYMRVASGAKDKERTRSKSTASDAQKNKRYDFLQN